MLHIKPVITEVTALDDQAGPRAAPQPLVAPWVRGLCSSLIRQAPITLMIAASLMCPTQSIAGEDRALQRPQPFKVIYQADYRGLPISARGIRELSRQNLEGAEASLYTLTSSALSIFAKFTEQSDFIMVGDTARPQFYRYDRTDRLLYQFQLQTDLLNQGADISLGTQLSYQIQDQNTLKDYIFSVKAKVTLQTPLGPVETYEIVRSNDQEKRSTTLWLAPAFEYMLIRFEQASSDGENFSLAIEKAYLNEAPILDFDTGPSS